MNPLDDYYFEDQFTPIDNINYDKKVEIPVPVLKEVSKMVDSQLDNELEEVKDRLEILEIVNQRLVEIIGDINLTKKSKEIIAESIYTSVDFESFIEEEINPRDRFKDYQKGLRKLSKINKENK